MSEVPLYPQRLPCEALTLSCPKSRPKTRPKTVVGGPLDGSPGNSFVAYLHHTIESWGIGGDDVGLIQSTKAPKSARMQ